jgi:ribonucleotide reductase alpha subunit
MHVHAWRKGLKTGMYYLRSKAAVDPIKFSIDHQYVKDAAKLKADQEALVCSLDNREACMSCSG